MTNFAPGANYYPAPPHAYQWGIFGNLVLDLTKFEQDSGHLTLKMGKEKYYLTIDNKTTKFQVSGSDVFPDGLRAFVTEGENYVLTADIYFDLDILKDWSKGETQLRFTIRKSKKTGKFYLMLNVPKAQKEEEMPF